MSKAGGVISAWDTPEHPGAPETSREATRATTGERGPPIASDTTDVLPANKVPTLTPALLFLQSRWQIPGEESEVGEVMAAGVQRQWGHALACLRLNQDCSWLCCCHKQKPVQSVQRNFLPSVFVTSVSTRWERQARASAGSIWKWAYFAAICPDKPREQTKPSFRLKS